jgi:hypothetical protein
MQLLCVPRQFSQVVEGVRPIQLAAVDQAHVQAVDGFDKGIAGWKVAVKCTGTNTGLAGDVVEAGG